MQTKRTVSTKAHARRAVRRRREGMTLIEIMIVVIIMAMIAGGAAVMAMGRLQEARRRQAQTDAATIRGAVEMYLAQDPSASCPSVGALVQERILSGQTNTQDPWGNDYVIECDDVEPTVHSMGPDGQAGTEDDI